jgi:signal transduction histidine kinase
MLRKGFDSNGYGQLRWVILLLTVAVILPTVCLLWFMGQAVENVRMAARQKLIDLYREKLEVATVEADSIWRQRTKLVESRANDEPVGNFMSSALSYGRKERSAYLLITYDKSGKLIYPIIDTEQAEPNVPDEFESAWKLEFAERNFEEARRLYGRIADAANDDYIWRKAILGQARCEVGLGRTDLARLNYYRVAAYERTDPDMSPASAALAARARVMVADLEMRANEQNTAYLNLLLYTATQYGQVPMNRQLLPMDSATRIFVLQKAVEMAERSPKAQEFAKNNRIEQAKWLLAAEQLAAEVIERYPTAAAFENRAIGSVRRLNVPGEVYGMYIEAAEKKFLALRSGEDLRRDLEIFEKTFAAQDVTYRVLDDSGAQVCGAAQPDEKAFLTVPAGTRMADWKVELYFTGSDIFTKAAGRQVAVYTWGGVLVIILILAAGGFAGQAVSRQIKVNRLKNDFIATVSHELKTPLASMRVLADTLLEGNYNDKQQATEYLQLICKENKRLSGLIDNFLTFSRMERNKQAFDMVRTSPAAIASSAAEAVKTEFNEGRCEFQVQITEDLPDVPADRDAMVTVLVNLLDNAYKYSADDKKITLKVLAEDDSVCFCICDNGAGMSRRAAKKIFERFYQVDRSLSRRAEGCGLGLSIAKFIVDAHKGSISVESKPGDGSTFTVKLPAVH